MIENIVNRYLFLRKKGFWILLILLGIPVKISLFHNISADYQYFLDPWMNYIKENGYFSALKDTFHNYTPSYIYILTILAKIGFNPLYSIKIVSILFDYLMAYFVGKIIYLKYKNPLYIWISLAVIPLIPTVLLNSANWGQCDSIYSSFAMGSIYFALKNKPWQSTLFFGLAFAFKMQVLFLLPFFFVKMFRNHIKFYHFLLIPAVYFVSILPAWFLGRPLPDLLTVYIMQANYNHVQGINFLSMNFPNIYIWISNDYYEIVKYSGMLFVVILTFITGLFLSKKNIQFTFENWVQLAFLSAVIVPFLLPSMHERYMYMGDVLSVVYFFILRKNIGVPMATVFVSLYSYLRCSRYYDIIPIEPPFFVYLPLVIFIVYDFKNSLKYIEK